MFFNKKWLLAGVFSLLAMLYLLGPSVLAAPAPPPQRAVAGGSGAGLRAAPGGPVTETLPLATALWVTGRTTDNAWLQVTLDDGRSGWVAAGDVVAFGLDLVPVLDVAVLTTPSPAASEAAGPAGALPARVATGGRNLNLRSGPGATYSIVGVAKNGDEMTILGRNAAGDWLLTALPDQPKQVAWAAARYLALDGDSEALHATERLSQARIVQSASGYHPTTGLSGKLVFQASSGGPIMVYELKTGKSWQLTTGLDPAISPDGKTVAFIRDNGDDAGLYLIGSDGGNERRIFDQGKLRTPTWSPDGSHIAFSRVAGQGKCRDVGHGICLPDAPWLAQFPLRYFDLRGLSRVDETGGDFRDIPAEKAAFAPDWGAAGIVYQSKEGIQVTDDAPKATTRPLLNNFRYSDPAWRPDGKALLFVSMEKDHREIFRANADGSGVTPLTHPPSALLTQPVQHVAPAWSPDGKHIIFLSNLSGDWAFTIMDADGRNQRHLPIEPPITYRYQGEQVVSWGK